MLLHALQIPLIHVSQTHRADQSGSVKANLCLMLFISCVFTTSHPHFVSSSTMRRGTCKKKKNNSCHSCRPQCSQLFEPHHLNPPLTPLKKCAAASSTIHLLVSSVSAQRRRGAGPPARLKGRTHEVVRQGETRQMRRRAHLCARRGVL